MVGTKMRQCFIGSAIVGALFVGAFVAREMVADGSSMAWRDVTESNIRNLAMFVEVYRDEHGHYPSSLSELVKEPDSPGKNLVPLLLSGQADGEYHYQPSSNGFLITVTRNGNWLSKNDKMQKHYGVGEGLKQFDPH